MIAVLNEHRQVLAVNDALLRTLGVDNGGVVLGLRPGEVLQCDYAREMPGGCGTSRFCSTCGSAVAIVESLRDGGTAERKWVMAAGRNGRRDDICLSVRAHPLLLEDHRLVLLFLQDITAQERRAALERLFFHDMNNTLQGMVGTSFMMDYLDDRELRKMVKPLQLMMSRLAKEVRIEGALAGRDANSFRPDLQAVQVPAIVEGVQSVFFAHPVAERKRFEVDALVPGMHIRTDPSLLSRILINMLKNAFEATEPGGDVRLRIFVEHSSLAFTVWNRQHIPGPVALRIFQRHFSTKTGDGRGFGTYAMKYFGEDLLGGTVRFSSTQDEGTVFRLDLPIAV
jgi:signal transduction histidine kinase